MELVGGFLIGALASRLSRLFGNSPQFWLNVQRAVDLWDASKKLKKEISRIRPLAVADLVETAELLADIFHAEEEIAAGKFIEHRKVKAELLSRFKKDRLAAECAKADPRNEQEIAEEGTYVIGKKGRGKWVDPKELLGRIDALRESANIPPLNDEIIRKARSEGRR